MIKYHNEDLTRAFVTTKEGIKLSMPRYFKDKIWNPKKLKKVNKIIQDSMIEKLQDIDLVQNHWSIVKEIQQTEQMLRSKRNKI